MWLKDNKVLTESSDLDLSRKGNTHTLTLFNPSREHAGHLSCCVFNRSGEKWHHFALSVEEAKNRKGREVAPGVTTFPQSQVLETAGSLVRFPVRITGYPEPRLHLLKNGKRLKPNENVSIGKKWKVLIQRSK